MENSQKVFQQTKQLKDKVERYEKLKGSWEDALVLIDLANEENDESMLPEVKKTVDEISAELDKMTLETLLSGPYDKNHAIITLHAGAGGTEAQDWCEMLLRMYQMYAQKNGYTVQTLDILPGDDAGTKSATKQRSTQAAQTITPGTTDKTIASGKYLTGKQTVKGDANLVAGNIKSGVSIFGVSGSYEGSGGIDTSDATATAEDIVSPATAYVNSEKVTGSLKPSAIDTDVGSLYVGVDDNNKLYFRLTNPSSSYGKRRVVDVDQNITLRHPLANFGDATAADVVAGKTFTSAAGLKVTGTHECAGGTTPTLQSKTVTPSESEQTISPDSGYDGLSSVTVEAVSNTYVGSGVTKKAAQTITPGTADQTLAAGQYLNGAQTIKGDANLLAENIRNGVSIFGVTGSYEGSSGGSSGRTLVSKSGTTQTASFDTGLSEIVAIVLKRSVDTTGLANASFVPLLATGTATGCSNYNAYMKNYATITSVSDYCNVEGGTFHWTTTNTTFRFVDTKKYDWYAIGYE